MPVPSSRQPTYRFGLFEVFPDSGELWKHGHRLKIQEQPFRLLVALLEQPGELVSREAIRDRLWPENTFVEFDQSLGTAVTKLRQTLGDEADNPRFIETVPKRGYRFLAPVTVVAPVASTSVIVTADQRLDSQSAAAPSASETHPPLDQEKNLSRKILLAAVAMLALAAVVAPLAYRRWHASPPKLAANDIVILAPVENSTGEAVFDDSLSQALRIKLNESPFFNLVSERALRASLAKIGRPPSGQISADDARAACADLNARAVISGNVITSAAGYIVTLVASPCGEGLSLATEQSMAASRDELLSVLGAAADRLRRKLGEPEESVARFGTPLAQATTSSLAALQAFSAGEAERSRGNESEALPDYKLASDLDPNFALAYARLGVLHANANELTQGIANYQKAFDLRERTTERERLTITAHYYATVHGDLDKSNEVYSLWRQLYPNDVVPPNNLADIYEQRGEPDKALESAREAILLAPNNAFPYAEFVQAAQRLGKFDEAKNAVAEAASRNLDYIGYHMTLYQIGFAEHDGAAMQRQMDWAHDNQREGELLDLMAWSKAARGQMRSARAFFHQAENVSIKNGLNEFAADIVEDDAQFEVDFGLVPRGRAETDRALKLAPNDINVLAFASLIFARAGNLDRAENYIAQTEKLGPRYTIYQKMVLPTARGAIHMHRNDPEAAIQELRVVSPYDLNRATELCPIYYRAEALFDAQKYKEAAAEYQRLIDHASIRPVSPYIPLSHLGIARSRRAAGDLNGARSEYRTFFDLWKDADPDIPILRHAHTEAAHL
jgi:eukaryotic-like serine/threonine-protein kinase